MDESEEHTRKPTVTTTPGQAWLSHSGTALLGAAVVFLTPYFQTKEQGNAQGTTQVVQAAQIANLEKAIVASEERVVSRVSEKISDVVKPVSENVVELKTRVANLELIQMENPRRTK